MNNEIKTFLESGKLEGYLMGTCCSDDKKKIEHYIETSPEVKKEYLALQEKIDNMAEKLSNNRPNGLKDAVISCLENDSDYRVKSILVKKRKKEFYNFIPWVAAMIATIITISYIQTNHTLYNQNMEVHAQKEMLEHQFISQNEEIEVLKEELAILGHNLSSRILLAGNQLSPNFNTTAFWNNLAGKAYLLINEMDQLDSNKCYQIWADIDGEMVNLGIIPKSKNSIELKFLKNAKSLNVTIEPKGGSEHPTVNNIVSSQPLIAI